MGRQLGFSIITFSNFVHLCLQMDRKPNPPSPFVIQERGFNLPPQVYPQFNDEIKTRGWTRLANPSWGCFELVHDFYEHARIEDFMKGKPTYTTWFRRKFIDYSAAAINSILNLPARDPYHKKLSYHEMLDSTPIYEEVAETIAIPGAFWQKENFYLMTTQITWEALVWSKFTLSTLMPSDRPYRLTYEDALLIYCIIKHYPIDVGRIISEKIREVANSDEEDTYLPYPGLLTILVQTHMPYLIEDPIFPAPVSDVKGIGELRDNAERDMEQFYKVFNWVKVEDQHEITEEAQVTSPEANQDLPTQPEFMAIYHVLGSLIRRVDAVHANQQLLWDIEGEVDPRFTCRTELDAVEKMMVNLSVDQVNSQPDEADPSRSA